MPASRIPVVAVLALAVLAQPVVAGSTVAATGDGPPHAAGRPTTPDCPADPGAADDGPIRAVYPNPVTDGDRGESVTLAFPEATNLTGWTLADGDAAVPFPNRTVEGTVVASTEPAVVRNRTDRPVLGLDGHLALSNGGETVALRCGEAPVDSVSYADAPEAERRVDGEWRPLGATDHDPAAVRNASVRVFALPDGAGVPLRTLRAADRRVLLAGYTFASARVADALRAAARRGVEVRVLLDGGPVGGIGGREARLLDELARAGVEVRVLDGPYARYAFHHPKYAVVDDRALVTSENWKPSGTGGHANRGWGAVVRDPDLSAALADVFRADANWRAATPWRRFRANQSFESGGAANGSFHARFRPRSMRVDRARLLVAPENAEAGVLRLLRSANRSVLVEQVSVENGSSFLRATVAAARRGVRVRVLLGSTWYVREENRRMVEWLNRLAAREGLPLSAALVEPRSRFGKIHVKGVVVDREHVVVGSLNWNHNAARNNREAVVVLSGEAVGDYYHRLFLADWRGGAWRLPVGSAGFTLVAAVVAALLGRRRIRFEDGTGWPEPGRRNPEPERSEQEPK